MSSKPMLTVTSLKPDDMPACKTSDLHPDIWYPDKDDDKTAALAREECTKCAVRDQCIVGALNRDERYGIFGGYNLNVFAEWQQACNDYGFDISNRSEPQARQVIVCVECSGEFETKRAGSTRCPRCVQGLVDIGPTRDRIQELRAAGWSYERIARATGLVSPSVRGINTLDRHHVARETEQRILSIPVPVVA